MNYSVTRKVLYIAIFLWLASSCILNADTAQSVPQKQVQIKAEVVEVPSEVNNHISLLMNKVSENPTSAAFSLDLVTALRKPPIESLVSPIITTIDNKDAKISVQTVAEKYVWQKSLRVLPHINDDKTISLRTFISFKKTAKPGIGTSDSEEAFATTSRHHDRESIVVGGFVRTSEDGQNKYLYAILTPSVVE
ncbi:type II and III secretion system protein [bacterium]|nr:type II and III secretion system protein [bacterium]